MTPIPTIETERLILRGPVESDFEALATFFADEPRSAGFGGPLNREEAWRWFASSIGHWELRGYGFWTIEERATGAVCGITGVWFPEGWPEPELGWVIYANFEGKGIAKEAAVAARYHAYRHFGFVTLSSNILPGNTRSVALAERMGAVYERTYENVTHGTEFVYRHPAPEALQ
ncbi:MAG: GNAT family N-acetyltransferase [Rhodobacteraceae bacterium]|nr:GNAT family N-acetyltransferase [Paracoccaceae bacterium]